MQNEFTGHYRIDPDLFTRPIASITELGAECIADIDHMDLLIGLRNNYLDCAKDMVCNTNNAFQDYEFGIFNCELAEKIQEVIDLWQDTIGDIQY